MKVLFKVILLIFCLQSFLIARWFTSTIDSNGNVGKHSSMLIDSAGHKHVAYTDLTNNCIKYAYFDGTSWDISTVINCNIADENIIIGVNQSQEPYILYVEGDFVKAVYLKDGIWEMFLVGQMLREGPYYDNKYNFDAVEISDDRVFVTIMNNQVEYYGSFLPRIQAVIINRDGVIRKFDINWTSSEYGSNGDRHDEYKYNLGMTYDSINNEAYLYFVEFLDDEFYSYGVNMSFRYNAREVIYRYICPSNTNDIALTGTPDAWGDILPEYFNFYNYNENYLSNWDHKSTYLNYRNKYKYDSVAIEHLSSGNFSSARFNYYDYSIEVSGGSNIVSTFSTFTPIHTEIGEHYENVSTKIDNDQNMYVFAYEKNNADLVCFNNVDGWTKSFVDFEAAGTNFSAEYNNVNKKFDIVYYDESNGDLKFATDRSVPALDFTGEANYETAGVMYDEIENELVYRIKYTDLDNEVPKSGYPQIRIWEDTNELNESPFPMAEVDPSDTDYSDGKIYEYIQGEILGGVQYSYKIEAFDIGDRKVETDITDVPLINKSPYLSWTGSAFDKGIDQIIGYTKDQYTYSIKYVDPDGDAPKEGFPKVYILLEGKEITGSPFSMKYVSGEYNTGAIYEFTKKLGSGSYEYYFDVFDIKEKRVNETSSSEQVARNIGPVVEGVPQPLVPMLAEDCSLKNGSVVGGNVCLEWMSSKLLDTDSIIYEVYVAKQDKKYTSASMKLSSDLVFEKVYSGSNISYELQNLESDKTYYWKVIAINQFGETVESSIYYFSTLNIAKEKVINAPNPFNPHKQNTEIAFRVDAAQTVDIKVYSEFGDLEYSTKVDCDVGTNIFQYNGRDDKGDMLFNGSHICRIITNEGVKECYLLIVK